MEPLNEKSQIAQEYGLLPADARQQKADVVHSTLLNRSLDLCLLFGRLTTLFRF